MRNEASGGGPALSVVVPTRNEAGNISPLAERLDNALGSLPYELIFVDDSTDSTPTVISDLAAVASGAGPDIVLIHRPPEQRNGLSGAVVEGIAAARGQWVCVMDADLQHPPEAVNQLLSQAERSGADLVVASRRADFIGPMGLSRGRALTSQILTVLARSLFPRVLKNVSDPLTGFFLLRRDAVNLAILQPNGFKILLEILVRHPELHVSEIYFDFAPRHEGHSKADLNEGIRYFRHVTRLRWTVNRHLARLLFVIVLAVGANLLLLGALVGWLGWPLLPGAAVAGAVTIAGWLIGEAWVFSDRNPGYTRRRLALTLLLGSAFLWLVYLPVLLLMTRIGIPYLLAALVALTLAGFVYYVFSEYWIWTRGLMMRPRTQAYYRIHDLLFVASQVPLADLNHFLVAEEPDRIDLVVRVDRHGIPNRPPGSLGYEEQLGRFGFGLTVIPGQYSEIVISPLLENSPSFLYTNIVEPVLHWMLVTRNHAFLSAAAVAASAGVADQTDESQPQGQATLLAGLPDLAYGLSRLAAGSNLAFMGDDRVILSEAGVVYAFPKPVTVNQALLSQASAATRAVAPLFVQRLVYSRRVRQLGIRLGEQRFPAATLNTYLQRLVPQPKYELEALDPRIRTAEAAVAGSLIILDPAGTKPGGDPNQALTDLVDAGWRGAQRTTGFQPLTQLASALAEWDGTDWIGRELAIVRSGLKNAKVMIVPVMGANWWEQVLPAPPEGANVPNRSRMLVTPRTGSPGV